jgi:hypothetical protein
MSILMHPRQCHFLQSMPTGCLAARVEVNDHHGKLPAALLVSPHAAFHRCPHWYTRTKNVPVSPCSHYRRSLTSYGVSTNPASALTTRVDVSNASCLLRPKSATLIRWGRGRAGYSCTHAHTQAHTLYRIHCDLVVSLRFHHLQEMPFNGWAIYRNPCSRCKKPGEQCLWVGMRCQ